MTLKTVVILCIIGIMAVIGFSMLTGGMSVSTSSTTTGLVKNNQTEAFYPEPTNYAVDEAKVLTAVQLEALNAKLKGMDNDKHQFGVAIVKTTQPLSIEQYGIKLAEKWKVGRKGLDNGAIIIIATEDRKVRIEAGYGLEGDINDAAAGRIIDTYIPSLKVGDWFSASVGMLDDLSKRIK